MTTLEITLLVLLAFTAASACAFWHFARVYHHAAGGGMKPVSRGNASWLVLATSRDAEDDFMVLEVAAQASEAEVRQVAGSVYSQLRTHHPKVRAFRAFELPL